MSSDQGRVFELRPDGKAERHAECYQEQSQAEQAATAMLIRRPDLQFVEIAEHEPGRAADTVARRITAAQPPAPEEAEIDDLHRLPRGDPEC
jgi:hypothetical protein